MKAKPENWATLLIAVGVILPGAAAFAFTRSVPVMVGATVAGVALMAGLERLLRTAPAQMLACSFCGRNQREVAKLIAGPNVYICDGCVGLCAEILSADPAAVPKAAPPAGDPWTPPG